MAKKKAPMPAVDEKVTTPVDELPPEETGAVEDEAPDDGEPPIDGEQPPADGEQPPPPEDLVALEAQAELMHRAWVGDELAKPGVSITDQRLCIWENVLPEEKEQWMQKARDATA